MTTTAQTAAQVRSALRAAFPGVALSVRTHTSTTSGAVYVSWTGGPSAAAVRAVVAPFDSRTGDSVFTSRRAA